MNYPTNTDAPRNTSSSTNAGFFNELGSWHFHANRHCIWKVTPEGYAHHQALDEVATALSSAFYENGGSAPIVTHRKHWGSRAPIIIGGHLLKSEETVGIPWGSIVYNLEQVDKRSTWFSKAYISLMAAHIVLDYSISNTVALKNCFAPYASCLPVGYAASLTRIPVNAEKDIDVLFYGSINNRRESVCSALRAKGLKVAAVFGLYGEERDKLIARAKIVLNLHFYEVGIFETPRVTFLMANGACVVSEGSQDDPDVAPLVNGICLCEISEVVENCLSLLSSGMWSAIGERALQIMKERKQADLLGALFQ